MTIETIRQRIADAITTRANEVIPNHAGDRWLSKHFQVLFPQGLNYEVPSNFNDPEWYGIANISGICLVRVVTDDEVAPDPSPLVVSTLIPGGAIKITPDPQNYQENDIAYKLLIQFEGMQDFVGNPMVTGLKANLDVNKNFCLMRKKVSEIYAPIDPPEIIPIHNSQ